MDAHYVESLRNGTAYPHLRKAIGLFTALLYILAVLGVYLSIQGSFSISSVFLFGLIPAVAVFVIARVVAEMLLLLVDIADAALDVGSKINKLKIE